MVRWIWIAAVLMLTACGVDETPGPRAEPVRIRSEAPPPEQAADFSYYLLALSWSPQYCADEGRRDRLQCGERSYAFVVHGLWPQNERRPHPRACGPASEVPAAVVEKMLSMMPSPRLIADQWRNHGTCSGLDAPSYFARVERAFQRVQIPPEYQNLRSWRITSAPEIERAFLAANSSLTEEAMAVTCRDRTDLREVRICMNKDLTFRPCGRDVRDTCRGEVRVRPVR